MKRSVEIPQFLLPRSIYNHGNYIISLTEFCEWLGEQAEDMGVDILPGIPGNDILFDKSGDRVVGVRTGDMGYSKNGEMKDSFEPGIDIIAKQTIFTEGCRGSLTERLKEKFDLERNSVSNQHYGIGLKEVWQVAEGNPFFEPGLVQHSVGWPLS